MMDTPCRAVMDPGEELASRVDFLGIGTKDLDPSITLAMDRQNPLLQNKLITIIIQQFVRMS